MTTQITLSTAAVLVALSREKRYGFDLIAETGLPSGTIYPMLRRLQKAGLVTATWEDVAEAHARQRPQRKYYTLTPDGASSLESALERFPALRTGAATVPDAAS